MFAPYSNLSSDNQPLDHSEAIHYGKGGKFFNCSSYDLRKHTSGTLWKLVRHVISDNTVATETEKLSQLYIPIHILTSRHSVPSASTCFSQYFHIQRNKMVLGKLSPLLAGENSGISRYKLSSVHRSFNL